MTDISQETYKKIASLEISDQEFAKISKLVYDRFGINLTERKRGLVVGRLQKVLRERNFRNFTDYLKYLENDQTSNGLSELINKISTNHTFFFREIDHFNFLSKTVLPELSATLTANRDTDLRIWSAGCSSGEEPYTTIITLMEYFGSNYTNWRAGILATDISEKVLNIARNGVYQTDRLAHTPDLLKKKYFNPSGENNWTVTDKVKKEVTFRRFNLMQEKFKFKKSFHVIFCRNVMIYFDQDTKDKLINRFYDSLETGGYLFIGHSESINRKTTKFKYIMPAIYKKE